MAKTKSFILTLIVTNKEGKQIMRERLDVSSNDLNRISAPEFTGEVVYRTKKFGQANVELADGTQIEYRLFKDFPSFLEYWKPKAEAPKLSEEETKLIREALKGRGATEEQIDEFLKKPMVEINKAMEAIPDPIDEVTDEHLAST